MYCRGIVRNLRFLSSFWKLLSLGENCNRKCPRNYLVWLDQYWIKGSELGVVELIQLLETSHISIPSKQLLESRPLLAVTPMFDLGNHQQRLPKQVVCIATISRATGHDFTLVKDGLHLPLLKPLNIPGYGFSYEIVIGCEGHSAYSLVSPSYRGFPSSFKINDMHWVAGRKWC